MNRPDLPRELRPFADEQGRLTQWPTRMKTQRMAVALAATWFEPGREYSEKQVNETLIAHHTFGDWALLRRLLFDWMFMDRETDGTRYRLRADASDRIAEQLGGEAVRVTRTEDAGPASEIG